MLFLLFALAVLPCLASCHAKDEVFDFYTNVGCDEEEVPDNCDLTKIPLLTVEDFARCAPGTLPPYARNYYLGWGGRGITYRENKRAFRDISIIQKLYQDVSDNSLEITTLGQKVAFPVGISPSAVHRFADPTAENSTAAAAAALNTVMILSSFSSNTIEEVAAKVRGTGVHLWMQTYIFKDRRHTTDIVRRAERNGYKAIVLTASFYAFPESFCDSKNAPEIVNAKLGNVPLMFGEFTDTIDQTSLRDVTWLKSITKLPIVVKGVTTGDDAVKSIKAGASAVLVSNIGGRELDGIPATIDVLPSVVKAVQKRYPQADVYLDGGIRNGFDVYKAIARGAKMVFIGRPALWGLTLGGQKGVETVLSILKNEFNNTMIASGNANPQQVSGQDIIPGIKNPPSGILSPILPLF